MWSSNPSVTVGNSLYYVEEGSTLTVNPNSPMAVIWAGDNLEEGVRVREGTVPNNSIWRVLRINNNELPRLLQMYKDYTEMEAGISSMLTELQMLYMQLGKAKEIERC